MVRLLKLALKWQPVAEMGREAAERALSAARDPRAGGDRQAA